MNAQDMAPVASPPCVVSADVCSSLLPDHMITSAGEVFVRKFRLRVSSPVAAFLRNPSAVFAMPPKSPRAYDDTIPRRP